MTDPYVQAIANSFASELKKIAGAEMKAGKGVLGLLSKHKREIGGAVGGMAVYKTLSTAEQDRQLGKQIRVQQQGY